MAQTYTWQDAVDVASKLAKGLNTTSIEARICQSVSAEAWVKYPWFMSIQNIAAGVIPLVDGTQDYAAPTNIMRLLSAELVRTDTTPDEHWEKDVQQNLEVDLVKRSPYSIKAISHEASVGGLRLDAAVQIAAGTTWEIGGTYQIHPAKVTALSAGLWFHDEWFPVAIEGVLYWIYRLADDSRAGTAAVDPVSRRVSYSGQLGIFHSKIDQMWASEELQGSETYYPSESMGASARVFDGRGIYG